MTDKKNAIAPASQKAASKMILKKMGAKRKSVIEEARRNSKEAVSFVQCSTHPAKGYSLMMLINEEKAMIYELKPFNGSSPGSSKPSSTKNLQISNVEFASGVTPICPACRNDNRFICTCGTNSCIANNAKSHTCPSCKAMTTTFGSASHMNASQSNGSNRAGSNKPNMPKRNELFLRGRN